MREDKCVLRVDRRVFCSEDVDLSRSEVVSHWLISACSVSLYFGKDAIALRRGGMSRVARGRIRVGNSLTVVCLFGDIVKLSLC